MQVSKASASRMIDQVPVLISSASADKTGKNKASGQGSRTKFTADLQVADLATMGTHAPRAAGSGDINFSDVDTDASGTLTREELAVGHPKAAKLYDVLISKFDMDGDGALNSDEFAASQVLKQIRMSFTDGENRMTPEQKKSFTDFIISQGLDPEAPISYEQAQALQEARMTQLSAA
jgi:hypothetical protein